MFNVNDRFKRAIAPYFDNLKALWNDRFVLWQHVMSALTNDEQNPERDALIYEHARAGKKVLLVIPERANPRLYFHWFENLVQNLKSGGIENIYVIFSGGVLGQVGTDGVVHSFENEYGEFCAARMDQVLREICPLYDQYIAADHVVTEGLSKNTGDQARMLANMIVGANADLCVFAGPAEHVPRFALTVLQGLRTNEPTFNTGYMNRFGKLKVLVYPLYRDGGWDGMTDMTGFTAARDAFGPYDDNTKRLTLFPSKKRGLELANRIWNEMYGPGAKTSIMSVMTLEDAIKDPLLTLELGNINIDAQQPAGQSATAP